MSTRWGAWLAAPILVLASATGCGAVAERPIDDASAAAAQGVDPPTGTTISPETETATTPPPESAGTAATPPPESAGTAATQAQVVRPAVIVPQLPVGGAGQNGEFEQCVLVRFRGGDDTPLPDGVRIRVVDVSFSPPLLERGGAGCSAGETPCLSGRFAFTAGTTGSEAGVCFIPVQGTGEWPRGDPSLLVLEDVTLTVAGVVECPEGEQVLCEHLAGRLAGEPGTIALQIGVMDTAGTSTTTPSHMTESSGSSETSETSGSSQSSSSESSSSESSSSSSSSGTSNSTEGSTSGSTEGSTEETTSSGESGAPPD